MARAEKIGNRIARWQQWTAAQPWLLPVLVFLLALLPRLVGLNVFLTADEDDQLQFAAAFLQAVLHHDWGGMLVLGYPGVPTMALGALGLWVKYGLTTTLRHAPVSPVAVPTLPAATFSHHTFLPLVTRMPAQTGIEAMLATVVQRPLDFIVAVRLPMVFAAAFAITLIFFLLRRLLPEKTAFWAILLVAFDPFFLANSRVIHVDAPLTYFMFAAFLAFLVYLKNGRWRYLLVSGILGGLAALSKTPAFILAPILAVGGGLFVWQQTDRTAALKRWALALVVWGATLFVAFVLFWPSMWAKPFFAVTWILRNALGALNAPHPSSGLFWGVLVTDRSPWYYTVAVPFLLMPLTTIGLIFGGMAVLRREKRFSSAASFALALAAFVLIFLVAVSVPARRLVRYTLPIFPALDVLAVLGLAWLAAKLRARRGDILLTAAIFIQIAQVLLFSPYFFDYTNPLLGGGRTAPKFVVLGWGEGLDRAAAYLNQKPNTTALTVAAWYSWQFAPYFRGHTVDLADNKPAYTADYTVFYLNQIQRRFPSEELLAYFADRQPEKIIRLGGMDYAWIYPGPIIGQHVPTDISHPLGVPLNESIVLRGMNIAPPTGNKIPVTLYWQPLDNLPADLNVSLRLVDAAGEIWGQVDRLPIGGLVRTEKWQPGDTIRDEYLLSFDPATPPGNYTFDVQMYNFTGGEVFGQVQRVGQVTITPPEKPLTRWRTDRRQPVGGQPTRLAAGLTLLGTTFRNFETLPGYRTTFKLYWQAENPLPAGTMVSLMARAANGGDIPLATLPLGTESFPADRWRRGEIMGQTASIRIPADTPPGEYSLVATVNGAATATLGSLSVQAQTHTFDLPATAVPTAARFGDAIGLAGYTIAKNDDGLDLTLYWRADRSPDDDLKVFVHITDAAGNIIAQRDSLPAAGARPTLTWVAGEIIADHYRIPLDAAKYTVWVGLYNSLSGKRLTVDGGGLPVSDNRLQIASDE